MQQDDYPVGKAGDGQSGITDKALMDAELIGAVCGNDADTAGADFYFIGTSPCSRDRESIGFPDIVQRNACDQLPVLKNIRSEAACPASGKQNGQQACGKQQNQERPD